MMYMLGHSNDAYHTEEEEEECASSNVPACGPSVVVVRTQRTGCSSSYGPTPAMMIGDDRINFNLEIKTYDHQDNKIKSITASRLDRYGGDDADEDDENSDGMIDLTPDDLAQPGFIGDTMTLESSHVLASSHRSERTYSNDKGYFTIAEVVQAIIKFELVDRPKCSPYGCIDDHHIYFEGLEPNEMNDAFTIAWSA